MQNINFFRTLRELSHSCWLGYMEYGNNNKKKNNLTEKLTLHRRQTASYYGGNERET